MNAQFVGSRCILSYSIIGNGPWVVMSHSLACDHTMWEQEAKQLAKNYRVLRFDTRGHGRSSAPIGPYSVHELANDVLELLDHLAINKTHFIGLSLGGMIGMSLAMEAGERLSSLVLCNTSAQLQLDVKNREETVARDGMESMVNPTLARFLSPSFIDCNKPVVNRLSNMIRNTSVDGYIGCCHAIAAVNYTNELHRINVPTQVIVSCDDEVTPVFMAKHLQANIRGAQLEIISDAGHLSNLEQPQAFYKILTGFLAQH